MCPSLHSPGPLSCRSLRGASVVRERGGQKSPSAQFRGTRGEKKLAPFIFFFVALAFFAFSLFRSLLARGSEEGDAESFFFGRFQAPFFPLSLYPRRAPLFSVTLLSMLSSQAARAFSALTAASGAALASLSTRGLGASISSSAAIAAAAADAPASAPSTSTPGAHAPRVKPVSLTLVLPDGRTRMPLRALPGSTLASVLLDHAAEIPNSHSALEGEQSHGVAPVAFSTEGRGAADAVVEVPAEVAAANPLAENDGGAARRALEELAEVVKPNSRLASSVVVDEGMEGAVVALAKLRPWATL